MESAGRFYHHLKKSILQLEHTPYIGAPRNDLENGLRGLVAKNYIIFYRANAEVLVARVLHGARNIPAVFNGEPLT